MPALLRAYQQAMPNVKVKVHDWPVEKNIAGVRDGRLQLAVILRPLKANAFDESDSNRCSPAAFFWRFRVITVWPKNTRSRWLKRYVNHSSD